MNKFIKKTLLVLGVLALSSCGKESSSSIDGAWTLSEIECYIDGSLIEVVGNDSDAYYEFAKGSGTFGPEMMLMDAYQVSFNNGKCSIYGYSAEYSLKDGIVYIDGEDDGFRFSNGKLTKEVVENDVSAFVDNKGNTHSGRTAKVVGRYKK